ncbi:MAG: hypothetical protein J6K39_01150 [Clostridia bacterium]|nr:hypothetical protein [Clostridia bacterium]
MKTSYYANLRKIDKTQFEPIAISGDEGKLVGFEGRAFRNLSPYTFFKKWKKRENEIERQIQEGAISTEEFKALKQKNEDDYIQKFYNMVLSPLNPKHIYESLGENAVLLCFEKPTDFCHRFLIAGWLEESLGVQIDEYGFENNKKVIQNKNKLKNEIRKYMQNEKIKMGKENE